MKFIRESMRRAAVSSSVINRTRMDLRFEIHHRLSGDNRRSLSVLSYFSRVNPLESIGLGSQDARAKQSHPKLPRISILPMSTHNTFSTNKPHHDDAETAEQRQYAARMADMRRNMRERAGSIRESARQNLQDFKDDPRSRTAAGAKSVTAMLKQYGPVFVATYMSVYFTTLGALFLGVESGLMDPVGLFNMLGHVTTEGAAHGETVSTVQIVIDFMRNHAWLEPYAHYFEKNPEVANLAVAWIAVKFTEPARLAVSVAITPRIARHFGYTTKVENEKDRDEENNFQKDADLHGRTQPPGEDQR